MPELPEVEIVKRSLFQMINKAKIIDITINNKNLRYKIPSTFSHQLKGEKILKSLLSLFEIILNWLKKTNLRL